MTAQNTNERLDLDDILADFLDEASQILDRFNENMLKLDSLVRAGVREIELDFLNEMFRGMHSLKGLSAMFGFDDINLLTHKLENILDAARQRKLIVDQPVVEVLFAGADRLLAMVKRLTQGGAEIDFTELQSQMQAILTRTASPAATLPEVPMTVETVLPPIAVSPKAAVVDPLAGVVDDPNVPAKYLTMFFDEAQGTLDTITEILLNSEQSNTLESTATLLLHAHRLKGSAASLGLNRVAKVAHRAEDLLERLKSAGRTIVSGHTELMYQFTDVVREYVDGLKAGHATTDGFGSMVIALNAAIEQFTNPQPKAATPTLINDPAAKASPVEIDCAALLATTMSLAPVGMPCVVGIATMQPGLPLVGLKARLLYDKLTLLGSVFHFEPPVEQLDDLDNIPFILFGCMTDKSAEQVAGPLTITGVVSIQTEAVAAWERAAAAETVAEQPPVVSPLATPTPLAPTVENPTAPAERQTAKEAPAADKQTEPAAKVTETLRVDVERLDQLMNLAGQLVINGACLNRVEHGLRTLVSNNASGRAALAPCDRMRRFFDNLQTLDDASAREQFEQLRGEARHLQNELERVENMVKQLIKVRGTVNDLSEAVHQLERVSDGLQKSVMNMRMVPVGPLFNRFRRVVRDITRMTSKDIQLTIHGESTELDKRMIDELSDPLIHMVRNSADHGIESPEARLAAGKPAQGTITLDAFHRGNSIVIQVKDDGKGLDPQKIKNKAIEKGIIAPSDAERMTPHQAMQLIWAPGFSTAEKVTEISGRGMGMDIVRSKIEQLNGTVELQSELGVGTTISIKLPLTLAILPSLLAEVSGEVFALPIESVVEIVDLRQYNQPTVQGLRTACVRGRVISIVNLDELFQWSRESSYGRTTHDSTTVVIVSADHNQVLGIAVDHLIGESDIVIKSLDENFRNVEGIAGASILGDGRVSLILDPNALASMATHSNHLRRQSGAKACLT
ncbi:MAG: chemotaxis protein CheA [Planctomycetaceae bacterium]|nr:chemotaxis protein CheA [Planctomycetaceae bacterium]